MGPDLLEGDVELTEFTELDVKSIKGVKQGANGFPVLLMKGLPAPEPDGEPAGKPAWHSPAALLARLATENPGKDWGELLKAVTEGGQVDEQPDIDGGMQAIALIGKLIGYEADELAHGELDETTDVSILCSAADAIKIWLSRERAGQMVASDEAAISGCGCPPDCACCMTSMVMASIAEPFAYQGDDVAKAPREFSADERKKHAKEGNALPDGSYPIPDKDALRRAAILARSGHGDVAAAKKLIARRAKELGVKNPLDDDGDGDSKKSAVAEGEAPVDTGTQETGSLSKAVEDALAKALGPLKDGLNAVKADLAKVMAAPVPGGPVLSAVRPQAVSGGDDWAAKAALYRQKADVATDPALRDGYRQLAREADEKSQAAPAA